MNNYLKLDVSRETQERFEIFAELLIKWNRSINLVSPSTVSEMWERHILDSAQLFNLVPHPVDHWVDMGTGGGFPGLIIAIMSEEKNSPVTTTMIESDTRKSVFLRTVLREIGLKANVIKERIEKVKPLNANVISARALSDLNTLFKLSHQHLVNGGQMLFPKGENWKTELETAQSKWNFDLQIVRSQTSGGSVIIKASGVTPCQI